MLCPCRKQDTYCDFGTLGRPARPKTSQVHPDGSADYVSHRPEQLDKTVRWICRTPDQDALGMAMPATAEPEGYTAEKAKGNIKTLPAQGQVHFDMQIGVLTPDEAQAMEAKIGQILAS